MGFCYTAYHLLLDNKVSKSSLKFVCVHNDGSYIRLKGIDGRYIDNPTAKAVVNNGIITDILEIPERTWGVAVGWSTQVKLVDVQWIENVPIFRKLEVYSLYSKCRLFDSTAPSKYFSMHLYEFLRLLKDNRFKNGIIEGSFIFAKSGRHYLLRAV